MKHHETRFSVRFNEADSYGIVWHGRYIDYFELGRLDLCSRFGITPDDLKEAGLFAPVVEMKCRLRASARYPDHLVVGTTVVPTEKAMLTFSYRIQREADSQLLAEGETSHVLLTLEGKMLYEVPPDLKQKIATMCAALDEK